MQVAILAGGLGTRLREETEFKPKPMVEIGGQPILWHIMKGYSHYGINKFIICLGYKGNVVRDYFLNYRIRHCDFSINLGTEDIQIHKHHSDEAGWEVTLAETGPLTQTGGRLKKIAPYIQGDTFMATYGDGVCDVDVNELLDCHKRSGKLATATAVRPSSRFGELALRDGRVTGFMEKPQVSESWINGGFFVFHKSVLDLVTGEGDSLEASVLAKLAAMDQLGVYQHHGFWQCMDTFRETELLNKMWVEGHAPWAVWNSRNGA